MSKTTIDQIEKQAKDAGMGTLYLSVMRAVYAGVSLSNKERGGKLSDVACVADAFDRVERAWALEERLPVATASADILLVQQLKDEIATSQVAKIVDPKK